MAMKVAGVRWTYDDLCRHLLLSGDTGIGKTLALNECLHSLLHRDPQVGGLIIDEKGLYFRVVREMLKKHGRLEDGIFVRVGNPGDHAFEPPHRLNLISSLSFSKVARMLVDAGLAAAGGKEHAFFTVQATTAISMGLELLYESNQVPVTLSSVYDHLMNPDLLKETVTRLRGMYATERRMELVRYFENTFLSSQAPEQREGVQGSVANLLGYYVNAPALREVFSSTRPSSFQIADVSRGKLICLSIPQAYAAERKAILNLFKILFFQHALSRFDHYDAKTIWNRNNLLILVADEYQSFITASAGMSDYNVVDRLREAKCALLATTHSCPVSLIPPHHGRKDMAEALLANIRNRIIFRCPDASSAQEAAQWVGTRMRKRANRTGPAPNRSATLESFEEYRFTPERLRRLPKHVAVICHCRKRSRKRRIRGRTGDGKRIRVRNPLTSVADTWRNVADRGRFTAGKGCESGTK